MIDQAIAFAATAHAGQKRKYSGEPYVVHPIHVMTILWSHGVRDEHMLVAAILHDVVEDTIVDLSSIELLFGDDVAMLVDDLTDKFTAGIGGNRKERKEKERERISGVSVCAQVIKYADLISNTSSIAAHDPGFATTYLAEKEAMLAVMRQDKWGLRQSAIASLQAGQEMLVQHALK